MMHIVTTLIGLLLVSVDQVHAQENFIACGRGGRGKRVRKYEGGRCMSKCSYSPKIPAGYQYGICTLDECYTAPGNATNQFDMCLKLNMDPEIKDFFLKARAKLTSVITSDLPDVLSFGIEPTSCGKYPTIIDDLFICATVLELEPNILGYGMVLYKRESDGLPYIGKMEFNSLQLDDKVILQDTIIHEMGHVLGIGTMWEERGLMKRDDSGCKYYGKNANREFKKISGCPQVPLEQGGGVVSACLHWSEECLGYEMLSTNGGLPNTPEPLSRITVGGLADLGYVVNYTAADKYTSKNLNKTCLCRKSLRGDRFLHIDTPTATTSKPKLTQEGFDKATQFGQGVLLRNSMKYGMKKSFDSQIAFAGNMVEVAYKENGHVHYVRVRS